MRAYYVYGGEKVVFDKEEIAAIKKLKSPGMMIYIQVIIHPL